MAKMVRFTSALYGSEEFKGDFNFIRGPYQRAGQKRDAMFKIIRDGNVIRVHVFNSDFQILDNGGSSSPVEILPPEPIDIPTLAGKIDRRFRIMKKLTESVVETDTRALILSGAAGIGKSYNLEQRLMLAEKKAEINKYTIRKGRISAVALYAELFMHQDEGDILVLDDNDVVFQDEVSLNLLKGALDTGERRHLSWKTASTWLEENGIDDEFEFNGACVFVTNLNFDRLIERGDNRSEHMRALLSRSIYLDLLIHSPLEIMIRVEQVVNSTPILDHSELSDDQKSDMMEWMWENHTHMRELSLRSVLKIASFIRSDPDGWRDIAEVTQLKTRL